MISELNKNQNLLFYFILNILFWSSTIIINSLLLTYFSSLFGSVVSFFFIKKFFQQKINPFSFLSLSALCLMFVINMSWLLTGFFVLIKFKMNLFTYFKSYLLMDYIYYLYANIYTLLFASILFLLSFNKKLKIRENQLKEIIEKIDNIKNSTLYVLIYLIIFIDLILLTNDFIQLRSYENINYQKGIINWYIPFLEFFFHFQISLSALLIVRFKKNNFSKIKLFTIFVSILLFSIIFFTRGRFQFIFCYIEFLFWFCFFNKNLPKLKNFILVLIFFIPIAYNLTFFNEFLRTYKENPLINNYENSSFINKLPKFYKIYKISETNDTKERTIINFTNRFLTVLPLAKSIELENDKKKFLLGENIRNNLIWTIPRIIFPNKNNFIIKEDLILKFGLLFNDTADSIYLFSYIDFWIFGILIYPIIFYFFWYTVLFFLTFRNYNPIFLIFSISYSLILFFGIAEGGSLGFFVYLRNLIILIIFVSIFNIKNLFFDYKKI